MRIICWCTLAAQRSLLAVSTGGGEWSPGAGGGVWGGVCDGGVNTLIGGRGTAFVCLDETVSESVTKPAWRR